MVLSIFRCFAICLGIALVLAPGRPAAAASSEIYAQGLERYDDGDFRGAVAVLDRGAATSPDESLLLGLAYLRLDDPARAAAAWADFVRGSGDRRLVADVARLRTLVVRDANRRAAREAVAAGHGPKPRPDVIAVLPFENQGQARYAPLGKAIAAMLSDSLAAMPTSRVVGRGRVQAFADAAGGSASARRIGTLLGAGMVVVGTHVDTSTAPMTLEVDSAVVDTLTGARRETGSFLAPLERFYVSVRDTAVSLASRLGRPVSALPPAVAARVQAVPTKSLEAAVAFGRGLDLEDAGDFEGARRAYESAQRADPAFALVRRRLATLPAAGMSLAAVAAAVQSEVSETGPPAVVAAAPPPQAGSAAGRAPGEAAIAAERKGIAPGAAAEEEQEEETTILGMSPMTAALVGGGLAVAIGGAAIAAGGGGGGGGGGNQPVRPPTITGVENQTVSAGGLIVLNVEGQDPEGSTVTLTETGAPSAATFDTTSGNPATGTFRWQTTAADGGQTVQVTFTATASRGPPNNVTNATATLTVVAAPPTPTPPPSCGGTGASCTTASECCQDVPRQCEVTPAEDGTRCCLGVSESCAIDADCCGSQNACRAQSCCAPLGVTCSASADCCDAQASCPAGACCLPDGTTCTNDADCCTNRCVAGTCEAVAPPTPTPTPIATPTPPICIPKGEACANAAECCPGNDCDVTPTSSRDLCCTPLGESCNNASLCCGAETDCDGTCCQPLGASCADSSECCGGIAGCVVGRCCALPDQDCSFSSDCCAGTCDGGKCSASLAAAESTPTPLPTPTPTPTPTPSTTPPAL